MDGMCGFEPGPREQTLFAEDFDHAAELDAPEPEVIEPTYSAGELDAARVEAWQAGHDEAEAAAAEADHAAIRESLAAIAAQMAVTRAEATAHTEAAAEAIARSLLDALAVALPALCARHCETELRGVIHAVLPALRQELSITVRVNPTLVGLVTGEIERLDPDLAPRIRIIPAESVRRGDVCIQWQNGSAARDSAALWQQVAEALELGGLTQPALEAAEVAHAG